ncbi:MAG TPA: HEAT repeat domain-containing protein [Gaiellaceae bacterium]|nr:HEAT repeat domain-containing protein [Gaiellaceae bacterium]
MTEPGVDALIAEALEAEEDDRWSYVARLQQRGDEATFLAASPLCGSVKAAKRTLGADVLGQLGYELPPERRPFREPAVALLVEMVAVESEDDVVQSIVAALGHLAHPSGADAVIQQLRGRPSIGVRVRVATNLGGVGSEAATAALIDLASDPDETVRDWASFKLAQDGDDTPAIRAALQARMNDNDRVVRAEALRGLAALGDAAAVGPLLAELEHDGEYPDRDDGRYTAGVLLEAASSLFRGGVARKEIASRVRSLEAAWRAAHPGIALPFDLGTAIETIEAP